KLSQDRSLRQSLTDLLHRQRLAVFQKEAFPIRSGRSGKQDSPWQNTSPGAVCVGKREIWPPPVDRQEGDHLAKNLLRLMDERRADSLLEDVLTQLFVLVEADAQVPFREIEPAGRPVGVSASPARGHRQEMMAPALVHRKSRRQQLRSLQWIGCQHDLALDHRQIGLQ